MTEAMKKYLHILAAAAVIAAACTREYSANQPSVDAESVVFTAGAPTRAAVSGNSIAWEAGDAISVWNGTQTALYITGESGASATFTTSSAFAAASSYTALYPYDGDAVFAAGSVSTRLQASQMAVAGSFDPHAHLGVAVSSSTTLSFKSLSAYVCFTVPAGMDDLVSVNFSGNNGEKIAGPVSVNTADYTVSASDAGETGIGLNGTFVEGETYFLAIVPQRFEKGFTLTVVRSSRTDQMVTDKDVTFNRSEAHNIGALKSGSEAAGVVMSGSALAAPVEMTKVEAADGQVLFDEVYTFRGALSAGTLDVKDGSATVQGGIAIPAAGDYHVVYNKTSGRFKVYTQEMYVDFLRGSEHGASVAPWKMLRNTDPDTVDDSAPNYALVDYNGELTGARCDVSAFTASVADYKYNGTSGNDKSIPTYFADDEEWTKGVLYDGLQILKAGNGGDSEELSVIITGLDAAAKYDFRLVSARFNASAAARQTRFTLVGAATSESKTVNQGWKPANVAAMSSYDFMSVHKVDFDGIVPDSAGTVTIKMQGVDTATRADAHFNGLRIAKQL